MSKTLVARALGTNAYEWVRAERGARATHSETGPQCGDAQALAAAAQARSIALLIDGRDVRTLEANIPARSLHQAQQAAPFAIEEEVADELEHLHVVCGAIGASGKRNVAVVRHAALQALLEPIVAAGAQIAQLLPDFLALPHRAGHWSLLKDGTRMLVRTGPQQGFACESELFAPLIARLGGAHRPAGLDVFGESGVPPAWTDIPQHRHTLPDGALTLLAQGSSESNALDLLPTHYRARHHQRRGGWGLAAALLGLALVVHFGFLFRDTQRLNTELSRVREAQSAAMREAFPEIARVVNAEVQATQTVTDLRSKAGASLAALDMIHLLGRGMRGGDNAALVIESLNYADGILSVRMAAPDIASLERYSEALKPFVQVEVVAVESRDSGVGGSLRVQTLQRPTL